MKFTARQLVAMGAKRKGAAPAAPPSARRTRVSTGYTGIVPSQPIAWFSGWVMPSATRMYLNVYIHGLRLISELNRREHHMATYRRKKAQQWVIAAAFASTGVREHGFVPPLLITMTRVAPRKIKDGDNAVSAFKHARDQIARVLGVDDGDSSIEWVVEQRKSASGAYGVEIRIEHKDIDNG